MSKNTDLCYNIINRLNNDKRGNEMYSIGQTVLYGTNGVCNITDITTKKVGKISLEYYVLKPLCSNTSTLFVPIHNEQLVSKIRYVLTEDEIKNVLENLPECDEWNNNKFERAENFKGIIASADFLELVKLIRLIHIHEVQQYSHGKRLHISDERILKEAEKMVCDEVSFVLQIDRNSVIQLILK